MLAIRVALSFHLTHTHKHTCLYTKKQTPKLCICTNTYARTRTHTLTHTLPRACTHTHSRAYTYTRTRTCTPTNTHKHTHTHTRTHSYNPAYTHAHKQLAKAVLLCLFSFCSHWGSILHTPIYSFFSCSTLQWLMSLFYSPFQKNQALTTTTCRLIRAQTVARP